MTDLVSSGERTRVLAVAAAWSKDRFCARLLKDCEGSDDRGVTQAEADVVYRISRGRQARMPRSRAGRVGARDYQVVADMYH